MTVRARGAVPCVLVDDLERAAAFYSETLGFDVRALAGEGRRALARRGRAALLLEEAARSNGSYSLRRHTLRAWDAVLRVDDVDGVHDELRRRGAPIAVNVGRHDPFGRAFETRDCCGNVLFLSGTRRRSARAALPRALPLRVRAGWRRRLMDREERDHLAAFRRFYDTLERTEAAFFMFFTSGLLHWAVKSASLVPRDVNLVLVGGVLTDEERSWVQRSLDRPFHHVSIPTDDRTIWEFVFAASRDHFGWLDIDCFVLNPALFGELARLEDSVAMNTVWSYDSGYGFRLANTHFVFVNVDVLRALNADGLELTPCIYDWHAASRGVPGRRSYARVPTRRQNELLLELLPRDERGHPVTPFYPDFYDTTALFQLAALASGYRVRRVRELEVRWVDFPTGASTPDRWPQSLSDELVHVGGSSYFNRIHLAPQIRRLHLAAEYVVLENEAPRLPRSYAARRDRIGDELERLSLERRQARTILREHLVRDRGLSEAAAERALAPAEL